MMYWVVLVVGRTVGVGIAASGVKRGGVCTIVVVTTKIVTGDRGTHPDGGVPDVNGEGSAGGPEVVRVRAREQIGCCRSCAFSCSRMCSQGMGMGETSTSMRLRRKGLRGR